jgi:predicted dehydrogenase
VIRVGVAGCGAVAQIYYAPALSQLESSGKLRVSGAFDPDPAASSSFAAGFAGAERAGTFEALLKQRPDLLVIASPPRFHCEQALAALGQGIAVQCEKPLASSLAEGERMVLEAERSGALLAVNMVRRRLGAAQAIRSLLERRAIGRLRSIEIFEGGPFQWPVSSPAYFDPDAGALGVLEDIGSHVLDLLCWWLGTPNRIEYSDDVMGGVAANCRIELTFNDAIANVRLSRDWHRPNRWKFSGDTGWISWNLDEWNDAELTMSPASIGVFKQAGPTFEQAFADQLAAFAGENEEKSYVSGAEALPVLRIFEQCAQVRKPMDMAWLA